MAKGDGSINEVKKPDGTSYKPKRWKARIDCGMDPLTKKRRVISRTIRGAKSDACKERDRIKAELVSGLSVDGERLTFGEFALQWQEGRESAAEVSRTRLRRERTLVEGFVEYIGTVRLPPFRSRISRSSFSNDTSAAASFGEMTLSVLLSAARIMASFTPKRAHTFCASMMSEPRII